jgi:hypothetical protein
MARYQFTRGNLEPLRGFMGLPLARRVLQSAVPIKRFVPRQIEEKLELGVAVQSRDNPDGVPLDIILAEARKTTTSVTGMVVRGGSVFVTHGREPKPEEKDQLRELLLDKPRLTGLTRIRPGGVRTAKEGTQLSARELRAVLTDDATPDEQWIKAFRRYAVEHLLKAP